MNGDRPQGPISGWLRDLRAIFKAAPKPLGEMFRAALKHEVQVLLGEIRPVDLEELQSDYPGEAVLGTAEFTIEAGGEMILVLPTRWAAIWADLMLGGEGKAEFAPEIHLEAAQELLTQLCAALGKALRAEGYSLQITTKQYQLVNVADQAHLLESHFRVDLRVKLEELGQAPIALLFSPGAVQDLKRISNTHHQSGEDRPPPAILEEEMSMHDEPEVRSARFEDFGSPEDNISAKGLSAGGAQNIDMLMDLELPVIIELGRTNMFIRDILELGPGSVVELSKLSGEPVDLYVNDKKFALGEVVVIDENFGIRITDLLKVEDRIRSLK